MAEADREEEVDRADEVIKTGVKGGKVAEVDRMDEVMKNGVNRVN